MLKNYWPDNEQTFNDFVDRDEVLIYYSDLNDLNIEYVEKNNMRIALIKGAMIPSDIRVRMGGTNGKRPFRQQ